MSAFTCSFRRTRWFGEDELWLEPDQPFRQLTTAVWGAFLQHPPYGGACDDVIPHLTVAERRLADLPAGDARGRGYVRLLTQDEENFAVLLEALGSPLNHLDLSPEFQIDTLCDMLPVAWQVSAPTYPNAEPALDKARSLAKLVARLWEDLGHPSSERITEYAI